MEIVVDGFVKYSFPTVVHHLVQACDQLGQEMNPPYQRGSYFCEIRKRFLTFGFFNRTLYGDICELIFTLALKHDCFYVCENFARMSTRRVNENYRTVSENIRLRWPGYVLVNSLHVLPKSDIYVHLDDLLSLLRSKDLDRYERDKHLFFGQTSRYTTGNSREQMGVCYATYPRSGNSLMRKYFENVTGTATGSDMILKHTPNLALQQCGFKAEGITDERVWIRKSHFPYTMPFQWDWDNDIAVICTRYQLDADPSFFYLTFSMTHSQAFKNKLTEEPILTPWLDFQHKSTLGYRMWFEHWIRMAENTDKPIYFFRFEDILKEPEQELRELFKFILGMDDIDGTVVEQRIKEVMAMGAKSTRTYKPRTGGTNKNIANFTPEQLEFTKRYNEELFHIFGYVKDEQNPDSHTAFMDFEGNASEDSLSKLNYFKRLNKRAFEKRKLIAHGQRASPENKIKVGMNADGGFKMVSFLNIMDYKHILDIFEFTE